MRTCIVTGGAGFVGSHLVRHLVESKSTRVIIVDNISYSGSMKRLEDVRNNPNLIFINRDISLAETWDNLGEKHHVDVIYHLAAESHVDNSINDPFPFIKSNIVGTFQILEFIRRKSPATRLLHFSTDEVYGHLGNTGRFTETTPYAPRSPYSASKASSDLLVNSYVATYGIHAVLTHSSNIYGTHQYPEKFIPVILQHLIGKKPIPIYGNGKNVRDWISVNSIMGPVANAPWVLPAGEVVNFGDGLEADNHTLATLIRNIVKADKRYDPIDEYIQFVQDRKGHDMRYSTDSSKAQKLLGYKPTKQDTKELRKAIQWYLDHPEWLNKSKYAEESL